MKVVLKKKVENIGNAGDIKDVTDGFARNFLIPNGLADPATKENIAKAAQLSEQEKQRQSEELESAQKMAEKIDGAEIVFKAKVEGNKLFGSIDQREISEKLKERDIAVDKSSIELRQPIKEIGEYSAKVSLNHGIEASLRVIVEKE